MNIIFEKNILYGASFNPPHIGHFSAISQMLEENDKVIIFPYPNSYSSNHGNSNNNEKFDLPSVAQRMKMLKIFVAEFFPQQADRLILVDLYSQMVKEKVQKDDPTHNSYHTLDYLRYTKEQLPAGTILIACMGFDSVHHDRKELFHEQATIEKEFKTFRLAEENKIASKKLREFFSSHKNLKSAKDELYIKSVVGDALAEYIFKNNLYGVKKKKEKIVKETIENIPEQSTKKLRRKM